MKRMDQKKNKSNVSIAKNPYCIALGNAGERTQGKSGLHAEGYSNPGKVFHDYNTF